MSKRAMKEDKARDAHKSLLMPDEAFRTSEDSGLTKQFRGCLKAAAEVSIDFGAGRFSGPGVAGKALISE